MTQVCRFVIASFVILAMGLGPQLLAATADLAAVGGRVFDSDLKTPLHGIGVHAVLDGADEATAVARTDRRGQFLFDQLPAGDYLLVLMDEDGQPLAAAPIAADAGRYQSMALALPSVAPAQSDEDEEDGEGDSGKGGFFSFLKTPTGAVVGVVVGAVVFAVAADALTDDDEFVEDQGPPSPDEV